MAADLVCVALDTASSITDLVLDLDLAAHVMRSNEIGVSEARELEVCCAQLRAVREKLQALSRPLATLKHLPVTVHREH